MSRERTPDERAKRQRNQERAVQAAGVSFVIINLALLLNAHGRKTWCPRVGDWDTPPPVYVSTSAPVTLLQVQMAVEFWTDLGHEIGAVRLTDDIDGPAPGTIFVGLPGTTWQAGLAGQAAWKVAWPDLEDDHGDVPGMTDDEIANIDALTHSRAEDVIKLDAHLAIIEEARIGIDPLVKDADKVMLLIHELGHALGYLHCEVALLGRRKKDRKNGKAKAGDARRLFGLKAISRQTGHAMHPHLSKMGRIATGLREDEDE